MSMCTEASGSPGWIAANAREAVVKQFFYAGYCDGFEGSGGEGANEECVVDVYCFERFCEWTRFL